MEEIMKIKKILVTLAAFALLAFSLAACGGTDSKSDTTADATSETVTVKLGVVGSAEESLWEPARRALAEENIILEFVEFSDYVTPNNALDNGEIDLNAFQHHIYLDSEIESYGYEIEPVGYTFIIPLNLYSDKVTSTDEIKDGDTIAIPNDVTNGGRALKVLAAAGFITLTADAPASPTLAYIEAYNVDITTQELAANTIPSALADVTAAIINGGYALDYGLKTEEAIFKDTSLNEERYWNLIAARSEDLEDADTAAVYEKVVKAFQSAETQAVFDNEYGGYFINVGWDVNLFAD